MDALDGLHLLACHQGQANISWDTLCALCEDAIVAAGLGGWDTIMAAGPGGWDTHLLLWRTWADAWPHTYSHS